MADEEKVETQESPTMPEAKTTEEAPVDPTAELKGMLEQYNVNSPDDFSGLINELQTYKKGYGDSRNEVGELRRELDDLRTQLSSSNVRYRQTPPDDYGYEQPQSVDLESVINRAVGPTVRKELGNFMAEYTEQQNRAAEQYWEQRSQLESRPNWQKVQPMFDKAIQNPTIARAVQSGKMTMDGLYSRLNERYLMAQINTFVSKLPEDVTLAQSQEVPTQTNIPQQPNADEERKTEIRKAVEAGDIEKAIETMLPDDDSIFRF